MAIRNVLLLAQIAGYVIGFILSLCIVVPLSLHQSEFDGRCLLFSTGQWDVNRMAVTWASPIYCHYVLLVGILTMIFSAIQVYRHLMLCLEGRDSSFLSTFLEAAVCMVLCLLVFSAGITVSLGFMKWCQSVSQWFPSCEDLAGHVIDNTELDSEEFYTEIDTTQFGVWAAFTTFVALGVASTLKYLHYHQLLNIYAVQYQERDGERQPLLNSGWPVDGQDVREA